MDIGGRIKEQRDFKNLTQKELGERVNKSPQVISNWERGYTPAIAHDDVLKLAIALNINPNYLLGLTDDPRPADKKIPIDPATYKFQSKTLADAFTEIANLKFKYDFSDEVLYKLFDEVIKKFGKPKKLNGGGVAAHGPSYPGSGALDKVAELKEKYIVPSEDDSDEDNEH